MKRNLLILPSLLALASCAPTAVIEKPTTDSRTYAATCAQALDALAVAAPSIRPASLAGLGGWNAFEVSGRTDAGLVTTARTVTRGTVSYGVVTTNQNTTAITWKCAEANGKATLIASSTGQQLNYAMTTLQAFWQVITLPLA